MSVQVGGARKWKRNRLVLARKEKLHLAQRVLASLEANKGSHGTHQWIPLPWSTCMRRMGIDHVSGYVQPLMGPWHWFMQEVGTLFSILVPR